jgi:uncharacterized protein HemY
MLEAPSIWPPIVLTWRSVPPAFCGARRCKVPVNCPAWAALAMGEYETALEESQRAMAVNPDFSTCYLTGAAAAQQLGANSNAAAWVAFLRERTVFKSLHAVRSRLPPSSGEPHAKQIEQVVELLRQAGLPAD